MKRLIDVLRAATDYLSGKGVPQPRLAAEQLMSHALKCPRLQLYLRFEALLDEDQLAPLRAAIRRLGAGEPLQYVVGDTEFMGRRFKTDRRALIPRPDTETLVEGVLNCATLWARPRPAVVDVGTGSGCVAISLALARPEADYVALDSSEAALALARENAALNRAPAIVFRAGDVLTGMPPASADAVVANLPYIRTAECASLPRHIRDYEPLSALDGGTDGLDLVRRLIAEACPVLRPGGALFLEIGFDQGADVVKSLQQCGYADIGVLKDLGGRDRVARAFRPA
jgi:release factor glutamine methyltransferase